MKRKITHTLAFLLILSLTAAVTKAPPRANVAADIPGGSIAWDLPWVDGVGGTWTNGIGVNVVPPTVARGSNNHDIHIGNNANVVFGAGGESSNVIMMKIGAMGTDGSNPANLLPDIGNPNGRLTVVGGVLNVSTTTNFNIGDANPNAAAGWSDPIRGEMYLQGGVLNSRTIWVGARRGNATHGGRTEGFFEQSGGSANIDGGLFIGSSSSLDNNENVNGEVRLTGGTMSLTAGIFVGALPLGGEGAWTPEQLLGRGHGKLSIGPQMNLSSAGTLELRLNSELVFELGPTDAFNMIDVASLNFYSDSILTIDGSALVYDSQYTTIPLIGYGTLLSSAQESLINLVGFDAQYHPSIEFHSDQMVLNLIPEPRVYALLFGALALVLTVCTRRKRGNLR